MIYPWQASAWQSVQQAKARDHLHHALLFSGEEGCGNEAFVQALAQSLLCLTPAADGTACGHCRSCQVFVAHAHPDFIQIGVAEDRQNILIEQIRELNHFLGLSRSYSPRRVAVIAPAERMNINAANSLLKSLEEPAPDTHILLLTSQPATLLPTIRSRCQANHLPLPAHELASNWLQAQGGLQHAPELLLDAAWGRPLAALELDTTDTLAQRQQWFEHLLQLVRGQGNIAEISAYWDKYDKNRLLDWQLGWIIACQKQATGTPSSMVAEAQPLCVSFDSRYLWALYGKLLELKRLATHPLNSRSYLESMLVLWMTV